ncbi:MAG: hypothetical protein A2W91_01155 [Bacteroidetes bacterium GWF2_38_335]|nr:MAG: hypothetical protein A2W91_01155 [Bacteroidetes bacterium GWF2_38_335]OFY80360.1 MAG: hypothetical protein A2281_17665 [Bacteroidetes bacterium RIFOXYA12_FULL_38_20]HBS88839.1 hypothetical protein [Bacteroidales bacterium]
MKNEINKVAEFHRQFKVNISKSPCIPLDRKDLRLSLIFEEFSELKKAVTDDNLIETFDALIDLQYVLLGTVLEFGFQDFFEEGFCEVHKSNMTKLDSNGNPLYREDGKVIKSDLYIKPNLNTVINNL